MKFVNRVDLAPRPKFVAFSSLLCVIAEVVLINALVIAEKYFTVVVIASFGEAALWRNEVKEGLLVVKRFL